MIELSVDQQRNGLTALAKAIKAAGPDAGTLKRELAKELRGIVAPTVAEQKSRIMRIASKGHPGQGLRRSVANQTRGGVRFSGRNVGVNIVQRARGMPRDFNMAGRALNRAEGWNPVDRSGGVHHQVARPEEWFDQPGLSMPKDARAAVSRALENTAQRLADQIKRTGR